MVAGYHAIEGRVVGLIMPNEIAKATSRPYSDSRVQFLDARDGGFGSLKTTLA